MGSIGSNTRSVSRAVADILDHAGDTLSNFYPAPELGVCASIAYLCRRDVREQATNLLNACTDSTAGPCLLLPRWCLSRGVVFLEVDLLNIKGVPTRTLSFWPCEACPCVTVR